MNNLKKYLGLVWMVLGVLARYYLFVNQALEMWTTGLSDVKHIDKLVPAIIYTFILTPIIVGGMFIFGKYAWQGEFSDEI